MIFLTHLNGKPFAVNCDLIKYVEETPDTLITLINNERVIVGEKMDVVIERVIQYSRLLRVFPQG